MPPTTIQMREGCGALLEFFDRMKPSGRLCPDGFCAAYSAFSIRWKIPLRKRTSPVRL